MIAAAPRQGLGGEGERIFPIGRRRTVEAIETGGCAQEEQHFVGPINLQGVPDHTQGATFALNSQPCRKGHAFFAVDYRVFAPQILWIVLLWGFAGQQQLAAACACT